MNTITDQLADALRLLDNVTAMTDSEADSLGQAENILRGLVDVQLEGGPLAPSPRIGIKMEGGVIQNVFADTEAVVYVIDYDVEDAAPPDGYENEDHAVCQLEQDGGGTAECVLSRYGAEVSPRWFQRMDAALAVRSAELDEEQEHDGGGMTP